MTDPATPKPTLRKAWTVLAPCDHCQARTLQVRGPKAPPAGMGSCLQCLADGGTCCTLRHYTRWPQ
jgi:hypothetical protein